MGVRSLANTYRPKTFDQVVGQGEAIKILTSSVLRKQIYGSYLIDGPFGTGKTTLARIFSRRILCENPSGIESCGQCDSCKAFDDESNPNYREVDAATHSGVDSVRALKSFAASGALGGEGWKVIVVDEAHDLSPQAQDVLLKMLEEARQGLVFVLCTTVGEQILNTVRSRSVVCHVTTPSSTEVTERLQWIAEQEGVKVEEEALRLIVTQTHLHLRDAIKELEVLSVTGGGDITRAHAAEHYGLGSYDEVLQFLCSVGPNPLEAVDLACRIASQRGVPHFYRLTRLLLSDVLAIKFRQPSLVRVLDPEGDLAAVNTIASTLGRRVVLLSQFVIETSNRPVDWETLVADVLYMNGIVTQDIVFRKTAAASIESVSFENQRDAEEMNRLLADPAKLYQAGKRKAVKPDPAKVEDTLSEGDFIEELWNDVQALESSGREPPPPPPPPSEAFEPEKLPGGEAPLPEDVESAIDSAFLGEEPPEATEPPPPPEREEPAPPPPEPDGFDPSDPFAGCFDS